MNCYLTIFDSLEGSKLSHYWFQCFDPKAMISEGLNNGNESGLTRCFVCFSISFVLNLHRPQKSCSSQSQGGVDLTCRLSCTCLSDALVHDGKPLSPCMRRSIKYCRLPIPSCLYSIIFDFLRYNSVLICKSFNKFIRALKCHL